MPNHEFLNRLTSLGIWSVLIRDRLSASLQAEKGFRTTRKGGKYFGKSNLTHPNNGTLRVFSVVLLLRRTRDFIWIHLAGYGYSRWGGPRKGGWTAHGLCPRQLIASHNHSFKRSKDNLKPYVIYHSFNQNQCMCLPSHQICFHFHRVS